MEPTPFAQYMSEWWMDAGKCMREQQPTTVLGWMVSFMPRAFNHSNPFHVFSGCNQDIKRTPLLTHKPERSLNKCVCRTLARHKTQHWPSQAVIHSWTNYHIHGPDEAFIDVQSLQRSTSDTVRMHMAHVPHYLIRYKRSL